MGFNLMIERSVREWEDWLDSASDSDYEAALEYWATKKRLWNLRELEFGKGEKDELVRIQTALYNLGVENREFMSYATV